MLKSGMIGGFLFLCLLAPLTADVSIGPNEKIVSVVRVYHWGNNGWTVGQKIKTVTETYDAQGRLALVEFNDGENRPLERTEIAYTKSGSQKSVYDPTGALIRRAVIKRSGTAETETVTDTKGKVLFRYKRTYGPGRRLKQSVRLTAAGDTLFITNYAYNDEGLLTAFTVANPDGSAATVVTYKYLEVDDDGGWITRAEYYSYADVGIRPHEIVTRSRVSEEVE